MLNSGSVALAEPTACARPFAPAPLPTGAPKLTAVAAAGVATADGARRQRQLPEFRLPMFGYRLDWGVRCRGESG